MIQMVSQRPRPLVRTILCALLLTFVCQATVSVRSASAAGSGSQAIQGLARIIHGGSSRNCEVAQRDGRAEP